MTFFNQKEKLIGVFGTTLFHLLLLLIFFYLGLSYQDPPPPEEGINIDFGIKDNNENISKNSNKENIKNINPEKNTVKSIENNEKQIVTQENIITKNTAKKEKKEDDKIEDDKKNKINTKALYKGKKTNNKENKLEQDNFTDQNNSNQNQESNYNLSENGSKNNFQLKGRTAEFKAKPIYNSQEQGIVVVLITVNQNGDVINAISGAKGSTTLNKNLLKRAKEAALKTKFNEKKSAPKNQQGKIIYYFSLN
tara:strand:+ start:491 stop:1243 length:753 start_codon:yes stop_codon:yes gene_type:complete